MQNENINDIVIVEKPSLTFKDQKNNDISLISKEDQEFLESKYKEMVEFMRNNHDQSLEESKKDALYGELQTMWEEISGKHGGRLNSIKFSLILYRSEYKYLIDLFKNKFEYNVDTVFVGMELRNMLENMVKDSKFKGDNDAIAFNMTPVDVHYIFQLISTVTVKGMGKKTEHFAEIIKRIALTSKIFNYYKETYVNLSKAIQVWVASLDKGVTIPETDVSYQLIWGDSDLKPSFFEAEESTSDVVDTVKELSVEKE